MVKILLVLLFVLFVILAFFVSKLYVLVKAVDDFSHHIGKNVDKMESNLSELSQRVNHLQDDAK